MPRSRLRAAAPWMAALVALAGLYGPFASPDVLPADSGELQLAVRHLGVAHPPGYALYTVVAHVGARLVTATGLDAVLRAVGPATRTAPEGLATGDDWTLAVNAMSLLLAAATVLVAAWTARRLGAGRGGMLVSALLLGLGPTFLAQSGIANIRTPTALLAAVVLALAVAILVPEPSRPGLGPPAAGGDRALVALALVCGLAVGHHPSLAFVAAPAALAALAARRDALRRPRTVAALAAALLLSLLPLPYLPLRDAAGALFAPGTLQTPRGLLEHVTGYGFRGDLGPGDLTALADRSRVVAEIVARELGLLGLALAAAGLAAVALDRSRRWSGAVVALAAALIALLAALYRAPQTSEYLMPAYVALALLAGAGAGALDRAIARSALPWASVAFGLLVVGTGAGLPGAVAAARPLPEPVVPLAAAACAGDARVLAAWHHATPLWYAGLHLVPLPGPGVDYVYPEGAEPIGATWLRRVGALDGPALLTNRTTALFASGPALWPTGDLPAFATRPNERGDADPCAAAWPGARDTSLPHDRVRFGDLVALAAEPPATLRTAPGALPSLRLAFEATAPVAEPLTILVQLLDPETGMLWGQADHPHEAARWSDPGGLVDRLPLAVFEGDPPPRLEVAVGVYRSGPDGPERLAPATATGAERAPDALARLGVVPTDALAPTPARPTSGSAPGPGVPFGDAMRLVEGTARRAGDELVVDLQWVAGRAHLSDYTVSVQARGEGWSAQHDGTPALGMFPTLKWLPGMRVRDRHRLALPADLPAGAPLSVTVGVYDAFSLEPLPVLDRARVARGEGQAAALPVGGAP